LKKSIGVKIRNNKEIDIEINIIYTIGNGCKSIIRFGAGVVIKNFVLGLFVREIDVKIKKIN
jgi:hypothetical protein